MDLELMCTWCLVGVMCDLPIRRCVSGLGMYPCCRCAMTVGSVVHVRGFVLVAPFRACIIYRCYYYRITAVAFLGRSLQKGLPVLGIHIVRCVSMRVCMYYLSFS